MYFILQTVEEQLTGKRRAYSKDFLMCDRQHLMLEYEEVESSSEWAVTLNQSKVILLEYEEHFKILEWTLFITRLHLLCILFRVPYMLDLLPYYLSITNGAGGVGILEILVFQYFLWKLSS